MIRKPVEWLLRIEPMPLAWFSYPEAMRAWHGPLQEELDFLEMLVAGSLAGVAQKPTARELSAWLRSPERCPRKELVYSHIFETIRARERPLLLSRAHLSIHEIARAVILSAARAPGLIHWLHQCAMDPKAMVSASPP